MEKADVGLIGLAVTGRNLAINMQRHGYRVAVYNPAWEKTEEFITGPARGLGILPARTIAELVGGLKTPRRVFLTVNDSAAVDSVIVSLAPLLETSDIIIDAGDSFFEDTARREKALAASGIRFLGVGISGGGEGALNGFGVMPGGSREAWVAAGRVLMDISAKVDGSPCCVWIGPDGAGHFVKMVHNGIECCETQLIAESYYLMREMLGMDAAGIQSIFRLWSSGMLGSYLIEITCDILGNLDKATGKPLVDLILDELAPSDADSGAVRQALDSGITAPTIAEAVFARRISAIKNERTVASGQITGAVEKPALEKYAFIDDIGQALYASRICSYAQGFALMKAVSTERGWNLKPGDIAMVWRGGGILRARFLEFVKQAYDENPMLPNLLLASAFQRALKDAQLSWRRVVSAAMRAGVAVPCMSSALMYFDSYRSANSPVNLIRAQRDYFGEHSYRRADMPGDFHTEWIEE